MDTEAAFTNARLQMVEEQIVKRGIKDLRVLDAIRNIPRHKFIDIKSRSEAYLDHPVSVGFGQTISQPYIVAYMTEALRIKPGDRILEIGTGCGYQTAVLASLCHEVFTVEIIPELIAQAKEILLELGFRNVNYLTGDGTFGWSIEPIEFDAIICAAAPRAIPETLTAQLREGGRMIIPVGEGTQNLVLIEKKNGKLESRNLLPVRFVPMTGAVDSAS
ncbi:MAG: protein-L-isoaspartate(D-aspartate) O-methyltransferase [Spirochaetia bacterium]|nr:protein-L-isoaspartate(D-aspartate) O-methyltransferase [Spirochaetia bacterium]